MKENSNKESSKDWRQENSVTHKTLDSQSHAITKKLLSNQKPKNTRTSKPYPNFMLLQNIRDCVCNKPAYHTWLSYRETHVYKVLYTTMYNNNPHIQLKKFQIKNNSKGFWAHYTVNQKQDKRTTLRIRNRTKTGKEPTG